MRRLPLQNPNCARKKRADRSRPFALTVAAVFTAATFFSRASAAPSALPLDSSLLFVLDGTISSHAKIGTRVPAHLRDALVVDGRTIAPAGSPETIEITQSSAAQMGNVDGSVDIFFEPLRLAGGQTLPLLAPTSHITPHMTAGAANTRGITDTVGDIFIPYHYMYHVLRKGSDVTLRPGSIIRARTAALVRIFGGRVTIQAPPPIPNEASTPAASFVPAPLATPPGYVMPTPKATASPSPTPGASSSPHASASP